MQVVPVAYGPGVRLASCISLGILFSEHTKGPSENIIIRIYLLFGFEFVNVWVQERVLGPLELELPVIGSHLADGKQAEVLCKTVHVLNLWVIAPTPENILLILEIFHGLQVRLLRLL